MPLSGDARAPCGRPRSPSGRHGFSLRGRAAAQTRPREKGYGVKKNSDSQIAKGRGWNCVYHARKHLRGLLRPEDVPVGVGLAMGPAKGRKTRTSNSECTKEWRMMRR